MKTIRSAIIAIAAAVYGCMLTACSNDAYDTGDGRLSYMTADFVDAATDGEACFTTALTDNGLQLQLSPKVKAEWATTADSLYRALLYYNVEKGVTAEGNANAGGRATVKPVSVQRVLVPKIADGRNARIPLPSDPLDIETAWTSRNMRYINLGIRLKTGTEDGNTAAQTIGVAYMGTTRKADGTKSHSLLIVHEQNGVPQYYSTSAYVSIPLYRLPFAAAKGDEIVVTATTYGGKAQRSFPLGELPEGESRK